MTLFQLFISLFLHCFLDANFVEIENKKYNSLQLVKIIQSNYISNLNNTTVYDSSIRSPKSVIFSVDGAKFYINSLEGFKTVVYDAKSLKKIKDINHIFTSNNDSKLFKNNESTVLNYKFHQKRKNLNSFSGKPVESCMSHNGKYLWVTYYRRDYDLNAISPSAIAIIDTNLDKIVRVIPCGPLPKMITCSPDNKQIAVTHWGDNTIAIINIDYDNVMDFKYSDYILIDYKVDLSNISNVNRDNYCGNCLRGTTYSPDGLYLLVAKMGGNGVAVIRTNDMKYIGTISGTKPNLRHLTIKNNFIYISSNRYGFVQRLPLSKLKELSLSDSKNKIFNFDSWQSIKVGLGARTISLTPDGKYLFACINNESKIVVVDTNSFKIIDTIKVNKFPVGLAISPDGKYLISTSQGKSGHVNAGNAVNVFKIIYS